MDTELDQSRLAGWEQREGYSPFMPPPGMVAHGQFTQTNDPIPVYDFGQFHTPNQHLQYPAQNTNTAQHAQSQPYQHTYEQPRFQEPKPQQVLQFPRFTPPLNRQAMPFTPTQQPKFVSLATHQQGSRLNHQQYRLPAAPTTWTWTPHIANPLAWSHTPPCHAFGWAIG